MKRTAGMLAGELMADCDPAQPVLLLVKQADGSNAEIELDGEFMFVSHGGQLTIEVPLTVNPKRRAYTREELDAARSCALEDMLEDT